MNIVLILITLIVLAVSVMAIASETRPILYVSAILIMCNDILFINIGDGGSAALLAIAKSWREIFIAASLISFGLWLGRNRPGVGMNRWSALTLTVLAVLAVIGIAMGLGRSSFGTVITVGRSYILPFLLPMSLYLSGAFTRDRAKAVVWIVLMVGVVMTIYSAWASLRFNGDAATVWYYDFIADRKLEANTGKRFIAYQIIREGHLRASGFLVSAVDYSQLSGILAVFSFVGALFMPRVGQRIISGAIGVSCIAAIELSQTRAGYVSIAIALLVGLLYRGLRIRWANFYTLLIATGIASSLILVQYFPQFFDASVGGRPAQLFAAIESFRPLGWGFGDIENNGPTFKDSLYLSSLGTFGVAMVLFVGLFVGLHQRLFASLRLPGVTGSAYSLVFASALALTAEWFIFGFHYAVGGVAMYVLLMLCFASLAAAENANRLSQEVEVEDPFVGIVQQARSQYVSQRA